MGNNDITVKPEIGIQPVKIVKLFKTLSVVPDNLDKIRARELWEETEQGFGTVVAVLDSGVQKEHPDLAENIIGGYNFTDDDGGNPDIYSDYIGHGTHVSGIIAAADNNKGVVGVAPKSKLLILKVIDQRGRGSFENLIEAIKYAADWEGPNREKVNVINMSLGGSEPNENLHRAIKYARSKGVVLVAAAGNEGDGNLETIEISYPGFYKEVIQVGSISESQTPSKFSNTNVNLDFVGPGENILSTHLNSDYVELTGTSMASPFVAGSAALILKTLNNIEPHLAPMYVYDYLLFHALPLENFSINQVGNGFIQLK
ncbi:S8 family peptidase [Schinkia azotoformans]|uniref:S8 family peptidase n=1 Tax=Schinkia azotoformans TaxID=1454 RepID=UPI002DB5A4CE|nr:S8 family peptidase [Schinkia azotoformans]MEC1716518.1 S8 family peptidase [Schinkia azotoformans]MEC1739930.1 S8 family peptidase [Schinkia azotoformans]MEC1746792.1 S8 family peptidase [Schinkia azotoformans]MEC1758799.1 S8 family peptidase [Schinkia azotoformans]MEC1767664.1 S8 family peptidase [Schinkia azotoformans]